VEVQANQSNSGFAAAVNQGAGSSLGRYLLLLNPDTVLETPDLSQLEADCETYGLASGLLVDESGQPQKGFFARRLPSAAALAFECLGLNRLWPSNPVNRRYRCLDISGDRSEFVEQPPGAFLMVRRDVWEQLGGMDEAFYPVWFEDTDLCRRALDAGYRIRFSPETRAVHEGGHSVLKIDESARSLLWYGSLLRYAAKHFGPLRFGFVCIAVGLGAAAKAAAAVGMGVQAGSGSPAGKGKTVRTYVTIMRLAVQSLLAGKVPAAKVALQADAKSVVSAVRQ
jgi:GT2 family glycosyltransferase